MIIREIKDSFIMIRQHDHAFLSGELIKHFKPSLLKSDAFFDDALYAAYQHDRSWIGLDETPIWNDRESIPFTFSDYPLLPKLAFYKIGVDEIERVNTYASLLCSLHFCSFFSQSQNKDCLVFLTGEARRQMNLRESFPDLDEELLQQHFHLLQFSDNLSLYLCLNEPGVAKEDEHPWFKNGFQNTEMFHPENQPLMARWLNEKEVTLEPYPFEKEFHVSLQYKIVVKSLIDEVGVAEAYEKSDMKERMIFIYK
ncbi:DUF3891 family protein [Rossellomorea sp. GCM10028870]|uniref:DUF3891 family protein n=1 Tax=Rossellomorea sp. GCM10028870 TaxID=3273426 RepID=UPI0026144E2A|nr:DUF3891 family protein [uncultured Rossellomorea sp.]